MHAFRARLRLEITDDMMNRGRASRERLALKNATCFKQTQSGSSRDNLHVELNVSVIARYCTERGKPVAAPNGRDQPIRLEELLSLRHE